MAEGVDVASVLEGAYISVPGFGFAVPPPFFAALEAWNDGIICVFQSDSCGAGAYDVVFSIGAMVEQEVDDSFQISNNNSEVFPCLPSLGPTSMTFVIPQAHS